MRNSLTKIFLGTILTLLQVGEVLSQPISLIPQGRKATGFSPAEEPSSLPQCVSTLWEGTPPVIIETYFPRLPLKVLSPALRTLREVLITTKYPTSFQSHAYEKMMSTLLLETGDQERTKEWLIESHLPNKESLFLDSQWVEGSTKKACEKITHLLHSSPQREWKVQNIYCLYLNGEKERAKIAAEVLSESNPDTITLLQSLFDASHRPPFNTSIAHSPFLLTVWMENGQDITEKAFEGLSLSALVMIARSQKMPPQTRLLAAEKALRGGAFKGKEFLALLEQVRPIGLWSNLLEALTTSPTEKLFPLFEQAEKEEKLDLVAQVFTDHLFSLKPSRKDLSLTPFMIRFFLHQGQKENAKEWGTFFMKERPEEAVAFLPLLHFVCSEIKWGRTQMEAWQAYQKRLHPSKASQRSYELRRILEIFKETAGEPLKNEPPFPSWRQEKTLLKEQNILELLNSAVESGSRGEILLFSLILFGETPLEHLSIDKLIPLLSALQKGGYEKEAWSIALEFLLKKLF